MAPALSLKTIGMELASSECGVGEERLGPRVKGPGITVVSSFGYTCTGYVFPSQWQVQLPHCGSEL
jgi:hypothetical protein